MSQDTNGIRHGFGIVLGFIVGMQLLLWGLVWLLDRK